RDRHADQLIADDRDDGGLPGSGGRDHLGDRERRWRLAGFAALVPDRDRLIEVVVVTIAQAPWGHAPNIYRREGPTGITHPGGARGGRLLPRAASALDRGADRQVADLYLGRLLDREDDCAGHRFRRQPERVHVGPDCVAQGDVGDRAVEFGV